MKNIYKLLPILFIGFIISCDNGGSGGGDDPTPPTLTDKLPGTWNVSSVKRDNSDVTSEFSGFAITTSTSSYSVVNGGSAWPQTSGTLQIQGDANDTGSTAQVYLEGIAESTGYVTFTFSNDNKTLTIAYVLNDTDFGLGGRVAGLPGSYSFVVNK